MSIRFNPFSGHSVNFFQQSVVSILSERQKVILTIAVASLALFAACFLISRYCLHKVEPLKDVSKKDDDQAPKIEKLKKGDGKPTVEVLGEQKDDHQKTDEPKKPIERDAPLSLEEVEPSIEAELFEDDRETKESSPKHDRKTKEVDHQKTDKPKKPIEKEASLSDDEAEQSIDVKSSQDDKGAKDKLAVKETKRAELLQDIDKINLKIKQQETDIKAANAKMDQLSKGIHESVIKEVSYKPDDEVEDKGTKYKASEFVGTLMHRLKAHRELKQIDLAQLATRDLRGKSFLVIKGTQYEIMGIKTSGYDTTYSFLTTWRGNGILPSIKLVQVSHNSDYNGASIINLDADISIMKKELDQQKRLLQSLEKDQKETEDEFQRLKNALAQTQIELKLKLKQS